jgi:hypothetical protein
LRSPWLSLFDRASNTSQRCIGNGFPEEDNGTYGTGLYGRQPRKIAMMSVCNLWIFALHNNNLSPRYSPCTQPNFVRSHRYKVARTTVSIIDLSIRWSRKSHVQQDTAGANARKGKFLETIPASCGNPTRSTRAISCRAQQPRYMNCEIDPRDYLTRLATLCLKSLRKALTGKATGTWQWLPPGFGSRMPLTFTNCAKHQP